MGAGSEAWFDPSSGGYVLNESAVSTEAAMNALATQHPEMASLVRWSANTQSRGRTGSLFERDQYVTPDNIYEQFKIAYHAAQNDDVVAGVIETSEALAISRIGFEADTEDEDSIWDQIAEDIDLTSRVKEMWRELFTVSQFYAVTYWGRKSYKVRGKSTTGTKRKKEYRNLRVPIGISLLDPLKVVPVGNLLFGQEKLAYIASRNEAEDFHAVLAGKNTSDLVIRQMIEGVYTPSMAERQHLSNIGVDPEYLFVLNPKFVWRHTETRPAYERFATVRMKSVFELLDLKHQLRSMDRAHLIGGTNFILLVKKGTDELPAKPAEVAGLAAQVKTAARVPVIVGDHRLEIEIITPKNDLTLKPERYNALDARLEARLFGMFMTGNYAAGAKGDDSIKLARVVGRGLEARRIAIAESINRHLIRPTLELNSSMTSERVTFQFHPKRIALDFDPSLTALLQDLRDRGDVSRATVLDEVGYDQDDEARKRKIEAERYDKVFTPVNVPFDSPNKGGGATPAQKKAAGRTGGGNRNGGGNNTNSRVSNQTPARSNLDEDVEDE